MTTVRIVLFKGLVGYLIATLLVYLAPMPPAFANPVLQTPGRNGGSNVASAGAATIKANGNTETITQTSGNAVIDWKSFNIGGKETTNIVDPNSSSLTVNRVHDNDPTKILGTLTSNGNVVLINPNGVFFGKGSKVDVNGPVATTSDVSNANVMAGGKLHFAAGGNPNATVENQGTITARDAGLVGLVAPNVKNSGVITAKLGKVQMSSGDEFTLDFYGDKLMEIAVTDPNLANQLVENSGTIEADGGTVKLTAAAARGIINSLITVGGKIDAPAFQEKNGEILIYAEGSNAVKGNVAANKGVQAGASTVLVSGTLDASGKKAGQKGGNIKIQGDDITIQSGSYLDASGALAGGNIKIGGDFHGAGMTPTALTATVENGATINANATDTGNGGNVTVWSDTRTEFLGLITAKGGPSGGNGGFVETSGHQFLSLNDGQGHTGTVDASAPHGAAGTWLLDPYSVTIGDTDAGDENDDGGNPLTTITPGSNNDGGGVGVTSNISHTTIETALNAGTNVLVTTGSNGSPGTDVGDITVNSAISAATGTAGATGNLTLSAYRNIIVNASITLGNTGGGVTGGNLELHTDNGGNGSGYIYVAPSVTIATNGGNITIGGGSGAITAGTLNADGTVNVAATGFATGNAGQTAGISLGNQSNFGYGANLLAGGGTIIMNGAEYLDNSGGGGDSFGGKSGVDIRGNNAITTSGSGSIIINGLGNSGITSASNSNNGISLLQGSGGNTNISTSGTGNVILNGTGGGGTQNSNFGVLISAGTTANGDVNTTGSGNVIINGTSGYNGAGLDITYLGNIVTGAGNVIVHGYGNNAAGSGTGVSIDGDNGGTSSITTDAGNITITGIGEGGAQGIHIFKYAGGNSFIKTTGSGNITLTGTSSGGNGVQVDNAGAVQTTGAGSVFMNTDDAIALYAAGAINSANNVTIAPITINNSIGVNGAMGNLQITTSILGDITAANTLIGRSDGTGLIRFAGADLSGGTFGSLSLVNGSGNIQFDGSVSASPSTLTMAANRSFSETSTSGIFTTSAAAGITTSGTGNITLNNATTLGGDLTLTTGGSGTLTTGSTIDGNFSLNATAGSLSLGGAIGGGTPLNNVSLTSTNAVTLPAINASTVNVQATGASGDITLGGNIATSGGGNDIVLAANRNFLNSGNYTLTPTGRWIIYSTQGSSDDKGGLSEAQDIYSHTYGSEAPGSVPNAGQKTWIYSSAPPLTPENITLTATSQTVGYGTAGGAMGGVTVTYTCTAGACADISSLSGGTITVSGTLNSTNSYYTANSGHTITLTPGSITVNWNPGYSTGVIAYGAGTLTVNQAILTVTAAATGPTSRVYDGTTTTAGVNLSGNQIAGDVVNITDTTVNFSDKNVGNGKTVTAAGISISGADAANYTLGNNAATTTANITARSITVTAATNTKTYDSTTAAAATPIITSGSIVAGDTANFSETYDTSAVGTGKTLTPAGIVTDGNGGSNYTYTFANNLTGEIDAIASGGSGNGGRVVSPAPGATPPASNNPNPNTFSNGQSNSSGGGGEQSAGSDIANVLNAVESSLWRVIPNPIATNEPVKIDSPDPTDYVTSQYDMYQLSQIVTKPTKHSKPQENGYQPRDDAKAMTVTGLTSGHTIPLYDRYQDNTPAMVYDPANDNDSDSQGANKELPITTFRKAASAWLNRVEATKPRAGAYQVASTGEAWTVVHEEENTAMAEYDSANDNPDNVVDPAGDDNNPADNAKDKKKVRQNRLRERLQQRLTRGIRSTRGGQQFGRLGSKIDNA